MSSFFGSRNNTLAPTARVTHGTLRAEIIAGEVSNSSATNIRMSNNRRGISFPPVHRAGCTEPPTLIQSFPSSGHISS
jgi:hypothetical protein